MDKTRDIEPGKKGTKCLRTDDRRWMVEQLPEEGEEVPDEAEWVAPEEEAQQRES